MKTKSILFPGIKTILLSVLMASTVINVNAEESKDRNFLKLNSVSGMMSVSGNGFGLRYSPMLGFKITNRTTLSVGPVLRTDKPYYAGYLVKGRLMLLDKDDSFSGRTFLYAYGSYERNVKQYFSNGWTAIEELTSRNAYKGIVDFKDVRFNGYEVSAGFGVGHQVNKRLSLNMEFGVAIYKTTRLNYHDIKLYYQPTGFSMHLALTARYSLLRFK